MHYKSHSICYKYCCHISILPIHLLSWVCVYLHEHNMELFTLQLLSFLPPFVNAFFLHILSIRALLDSFGLFSLISIATLLLANHSLSLIFRHSDIKSSGSLELKIILSLHKSCLTGFSGGEKTNYSQSG